MTKPKISAIVKLDELVSRLQQARKYSFIIFIVFVVSIYGFVLYRINSLSSVQPSDDAINSQVQAAQVPKIDQNVVSQLKSLQDNSVNVQSLFDKARTSPFQESIH
jgi:hypothetical protein